MNARTFVLADAPLFVLAAMCVDGVGWLATGSAVHEPRECVQPSCMICRIPPPCEEPARHMLLVVLSACARVRVG